MKQTGRILLTETSAQSLCGVPEKNQPALLGPMIDAGFGGFYIGWENPFLSVSDKSLSVGENEALIDEIHSAGRIILGSSMLDGDPGQRETVESVRESVLWTAAHCDMAQFSNLALLLGTPLRKLAIKRGEVIDDNLEHHDCAWPTRHHPNLSPEQRIELLRWAYLEFYKASNVRMRLRRLERNYQKIRYHSPWDENLHRWQIHIIRKGSAICYWKMWLWAQTHNYKFWQHTRMDYQP